MFDFDRVIERRGTHASKWDNMARLSGITAPDAIPMWVADMDFAAPPGVTAALTAEVQRATHGYYADTGSWAAALADWVARRHGLQGRPRLGQPDARHRVRARPDPSGRERARRRGRGLSARLSRVPQDHRRQRAAHSRRAACRDRRAATQWISTRLRDKLTPRTKVVFLCSPHNPGGTVWSADELRALAALSAPSTT